MYEDLDSSSSSNDRTDSFGVAAEKVEDENTKIDAIKIASDEETVVVEVVSDDKATTTDASSGEEGTVAGVSTDKDIVSMDELETTEVSFDNVLVASTNNPRFVERAYYEYTTAKAVTSVVRAAKAEVIAIISSGGIAQGNPSKNGSCTDPSLFN